MLPKIEWDCYSTRAAQRLVTRASDTEHWSPNEKATCGGAFLNREPLEYLHIWVETGGRTRRAGERRSRSCAQQAMWAPHGPKSSASFAQSAASSRACRQSGDSSWYHPGRCDGSLQTIRVGPSTVFIRSLVLTTNTQRGPRAYRLFRGVAVAQKFFVVIPAISRRSVDAPNF
jgi:hypothetical protein